MKKTDQKVEKKILPYRLKPYVKFNGGFGALICNLCYKIIKEGLSKKEFAGETGQVLCANCIDYVVYHTKTKYEKGFLADEHKKLLRRFPTKYMNMDKYYEALHGITGIMTIDGGLIYHCDIIKALNCGIEDRNLTLAEFD